MEYKSIHASGYDAILKMLVENGALNSFEIKEIIKGDEITLDIKIVTGKGKPIINFHPSGVWIGTEKMFYE